MFAYIKISITFVETFKPKQMKHFLQNKKPQFTLAFFIVIYFIIQMSRI